MCTAIGAQAGRSSSKGTAQTRVMPSDNSPHTMQRPFVTSHLATAPFAWAGLPMRLGVLPGDGELRECYLPEAAVLLALSGRGRRTLRTGARVLELDTAPGMFELYAQGEVIDHATWRGHAGTVVAVHLTCQHMGRYIDDFDPSRWVVTAHEVFHARMAQLVTAMWKEAAAGCPGGEMYAQGLSLALVGLLHKFHGARPPRRTRRDRFDPAIKSRIVDFVQANLTRRISLDDLARLVDMSGAYFAKCFRESFGATPHAYVSERRLEEVARALVADCDRSIAAIAYDFGFASQAHLTERFKQIMGTTPSRWRALHHPRYSEPSSDGAEARHEHVGSDSAC